MTTLSPAQALATSGCFSDALQLVSSVSERDHELQTLRAVLLERLGRPDESRSACLQLLDNRRLTPGNRSVCELTLGLIDWEDRKSDSALARFQRAVAVAEAAKDLPRVFWAQLRLIMGLAGRSGPQSVLPLVLQARWHAIKLGDPLALAALHIFVGELEVKQGLLDKGVRHTAIGQDLLKRAPNLWLSAVAANNLVAVALVRCDFDQGIVHAEEALAFARRSGAAAMRRACFGNLGNLYLLKGEFDKSIDYFEQARAVYTRPSEYSNAATDGLARALIFQNKLDAASSFLASIEASIDNPADSTLYAHRYAQLTKALLLLRQGRHADSLAAAETCARLAAVVNDRILACTAMLTRCEALIQRGDINETRALLNASAPQLDDQSPENHAHLERVLASAHAACGNKEAAQLHLGRATQIYRSIGSATGLIETSRAHDYTRRLDFLTSPGDLPSPSTAASAALHDIATIAAHLSRPELAATLIVTLLARTGSARAAAAVRVRDEACEVLASFGDESDVSELIANREMSRPGDLLLELGRSVPSRVTVLLRAEQSLTCWTTITYLRQLISTLLQLNASHAEQQGRLALWPLDEFTSDGQQAVIAGKMRDVMVLAQRVAATDVCVLITGESGTGKEILARAIHGHSARASRPFIPFNCTAVPQDLLESHLFGHRRGAFTGADRDQLGLIRAARGGTLFLDEVGELRLDLQPKLLRFLESGEINPLGEPSPQIVDVRIVAATNARLEDLVEQGRFREDLFYRLNVIRLTIPPLRERRDEIPSLIHHFAARAADEFDKGQIRVSDETVEQMALYEWPGNIRQLHNEVRRMVALAERDEILDSSALSPLIAHETSRTPRHGSGSAKNGELSLPLHGKLIPGIERLEREMIQAALARHGGKVEMVARSLGISRKGLYLKRQRLGL